MKNTILLLLLVLCNTFIYAQQTIRLNNGNVIEGEIIENNNMLVKIKMTDGTILEYSKIEIHSISDKPFKTPNASKKKKYQDYSQKSDGYYSAAEIMYGFDLENSKLMLCGLQWVNGYRFNEFIKIGIGLSSRYYIHNTSRVDNKRWTFPIYLDVRGNFMEQRSRLFSPYWAMDIGYTIRDNFFFSPTLGLKFGDKRNNFLFGLSYLGQIMNTYNKNNQFVSFLTVKVAYEF